jgi:hypothetical protein
MLVHYSLIWPNFALILKINKKQPLVRRRKRWQIPKRREYEMYLKKETIPELCMPNMILLNKGKLDSESGIFGENEVNTT